MSIMPTSATPTVLESSVSASNISPNNGREARNLAEKQRRDKLNASIQELAKMVPHVANSNRRMDKTAVLRFAAHGLRLKYVFGKAKMREGEYSSLNHPQQPQLTDALMQLLDSFFITLTCHGQIVLISSSVEQLLGHCQSDLYGQNIMPIVHAEDQALLLQQLIPRNMEALFCRDNDDDHDDDDHDQHDDDDHDHDDDHDDEEDEATSKEHIEEVFESNVKPTGDDCDLGASLHSLRCVRKQHQQQKSSVTDHYADIDKSLREDRRCFTLRLARAGTRSEATRKYEIVMIDGLFRRSDYSRTTGNFPIVSQLIRRSRNNSSSSSNGNSALGQNAFNPHWLQHEATIAQAALHGISGNDIVFVAMARVIRPPKMVERLLEANNLEYKTRHLIDGRIIDCDQRIGLVAGYMKDEVRNLCPFTFMHQDDVRWVIVALRQMYDCNSNYGESCFRLLSRNGHFIYLQSRGYLEIDKSTNKVHSFVCVNTLLDEEEGHRKVQEMKKKFSIIINTKIPSNSLENVPASQNPQQLERIVLYLIENLQKRNDNNSTSITPTINTPKRHASCLGAKLVTDDNFQLALVPPETDSIKSSISKSVSVVNVTAARNLQYNQKSPASYHSSSDISLSPASSIDHNEDNCFDHSVSSITPPPPPPPPPTITSQSRPSVLVQTSRQPSAPQRNVLDNATNPTTSSKVKRADNKIIAIPPSNGQAQNNISVLKRLPPRSNSISDESISPAKRSPPPIEKLFRTVIIRPVHKFNNGLNTNADRNARSVDSISQKSEPSKINKEQSN